LRFPRVAVSERRSAGSVNVRWQSLRPAVVGDQLMRSSMRRDGVGCPGAVLGGFRADAGSGNDDRRVVGSPGDGLCDDPAAGAQSRPLAISRDSASTVRKPRQSAAAAGDQAGQLKVQLPSSC
jgi:hypothetical protein